MRTLTTLAIDTKQKKQLNKLVKREKERGVSPFAKMKHTPLPTLFKILDNIPPKLDLSKVEQIEYKLWDEIGERIYWLCDTTNQYNRIISLFDLPLYLQKM
jgi:DNA phosphorothioation-dependent restriction protein DptG